MDEKEQLKARAQRAYEERRSDLLRLKALEEGDVTEDEADEIRQELGDTAVDYGLCIDFVPAGTFSDEPRPFVRYQLSTGGPGEEFRYFQDGSLEFWFLDWFVGHRVMVMDEELKEYLVDRFQLGTLMDTKLKGWC